VHGLDADGHGLVVDESSLLAAEVFGSATAMMPMSSRSNAG
jgi:hypothetical protein